MRFALISDIHANLPALQSVLADIDLRGDTDATYHLGDLVGYAPWPNETVALLQRERIAGIAGNYDSTVATDYAHCGCHYDDPHQVELAQLSYEWTRANVSDDTKKALGALPFRLDIATFGGHAAGPRLILVHGTPSLNTVYWTEDRPDSFCIKMAGIAGARAGDTIACGHTHLPWHREVGGVHFVNAGSVGRPKDGDWRAGYAIVEIGETAEANTKVEFVRTEYDVALSMQAIRAGSLPDEFADYLRSGGHAPPV